jgi:hypothetical protein
MKDTSRSSFANNSPQGVSLVERSSEFKYDHHGSRMLETMGLPHVCKNLKRPRDIEDGVASTRKFYTSCHEADVLF